MAITCVIRKIKLNQNRVISLILCFVIIFTCSVAIPFTQAKAVDPVTVSLAVMEKLLILVGVTVTAFILIKAFQDSLNQSGNTDILNWVDEIGMRPDSNGKSPKDGGKIVFFPGDAGKLVDLATEAQKYFSDKLGSKTLTHVNENYYTAGEANVYRGEFAGFDQRYSICTYNIPCTVQIADSDNRMHTYQVTQDSSYITVNLDGAMCRPYQSGDMLIDITSVSFIAPPKFQLCLYKDNAGFEYAWPMVAYSYSNKGTETWYVAGNRDDWYYGDIRLKSGMPYQSSQGTYNYTNNPKYSPSTVIGQITKKATEDGVVEIPLLPTTENPADDSQEKTLTDIGIIIDPTATQNPNPTPTPTDDPSVDPSIPTKPNITKLPDIGGIWDYVRNFMSNALVWMLLWFNGFSMLPIEIQYMLWALLVITIITGLLGVFLK